jgi:hypothetical protein
MVVTVVLVVLVQSFQWNVHHWWRAFWTFTQHFNHSTQWPPTLRVPLKLSLMAPHGQVLMRGRKHQCCEESCHNQWLVQLIKEHEIQLPLELTSAILGEWEQPHWLWLMGHMADQNCNTCHIWRTHCALSQSTTTDSTIAIMYIVSVVLGKYTFSIVLNLLL